MLKVAGVERRMLSRASQVRSQSKSLAGESSADLADVLGREVDGSASADLLVALVVALETLDLDCAAGHPCAAVDMLARAHQ